jgi:NAD(P)H dehydrogenase (quinone)
MDRTGSARPDSRTRHGGNEATILAMYQTLYHWGVLVVAPGYTDPDVPAGGQSPYGTAHPSADGLPGPDTLAAARHQGRRLACYAAIVAGAPTPGSSIAE